MHELIRLYFQLWDVTPNIGITQQNLDGTLIYASAPCMSLTGPEAQICSFFCLSVNGVTGPELFFYNVTLNTPANGSVFFY